MKNIPTVLSALDEINSNIFSKSNGKLEPTQDPAVAGLSYSFAQMKHSLYSDVNDATNQLFARTASDESFLAAIAFDRTYNIIQRRIAEFASGNILVVSESSVDVPVGSQFIATDGNVYESTVFRSTSNQSIVITALQRTSGIAYATIPKHNLGNLMNLTIAGANQAAFNGLNEITIVDENTIKYVSAGSNETATGTLIATFFGTRLDVKSVLPNLSANKTYSNTIDIGFTTDLIDAYITYNGITGGSDIEDLLSFQKRIVEYLEYPQNSGNLSQHSSWVKQNSDANYCYFFNSEDSLYLYLTAVVSKLSDDFYFTNFTTQELSNLKAKFIDNNQFILSGVDGLQFSFVNFTPVNISITVNGLTPSSNSMKTAINNRLRAYIAQLPINFYLKNGQLSSDKISSVIAGARDEAGNIPSFTSVIVSGAIFTTNIQKPVLAGVSYG